MDNPQPLKYQVCRPLTPMEYMVLRGDIAERGVLVAVELDENGDILDGHHRVRAWQELREEGIELADYPRTIREGLSEEQKRNHARRLNAFRRQMSGLELQRLMLDMRQDGASYRQIAQATGVSAMTVYNTVKNAGVQNYTPEIVNGSDGKQYAPTKPKVEYWSPAPALDYEEQAEELAEDEEGWTDGETELIEKQLAAAIDPSHRQSVHFSSDTPEHYTPREIIEAVIACMGAIDLDPCSNSYANPNVPATTHYTVEDDGLAQTWQGKVYMNPPYGREIGKWVAKLRDEYDCGNVTEAIALVPARTDTDWFDQLIDGYRLHCFVHGRLQFIGNDGNAPFPSALVYLGDKPENFFYTFRSFGRIVQELHPEMVGS